MELAKIKKKCLNFTGENTTHIRESNTTNLAQEFAVTKTEVEQTHS